jgi:hypothetical protein
MPMIKTTLFSVLVTFFVASCGLSDTETTDEQELALSDDQVAATGADYALSPEAIAEMATATSLTDTAESHDNRCEWRCEHRCKRWCGYHNWWCEKRCERRCDNWCDNWHGGDWDDHDGHDHDDWDDHH